MSWSYLSSWCVHLASIGNAYPHNSKCVPHHFSPQIAAVLWGLASNWGTVQHVYTRPLQAVAIMYSFINVVGVSLGLVISPTFAAADTGTRIAMRLLLLPLLLEACQAAVRLVFAHYAHPDLPASLMSFVMFPATISVAIMGRIFTTTVDDAVTTILLSLALAVFEVALRLTVSIRDRMYHNCLGSLRVACGMRRNSLSTTASETRRRRELVGYYHYLLMDTLAEDIAILTMVPLVGFFRTPVRPGGVPLTLEDAWGRIGVQWVLELCTDVFPFVAYGVCLWLGRVASVAFPPVTRHRLAHAKRHTLPSDPTPPTVPVEVHAPMVDDSEWGMGLPGPRPTPKKSVAVQPPSSDEELSERKWAVTTPACCCIPAREGPEVEDALRRIEQVRASAVVDQNDEVWDELPTPVVVRAMRLQAQWGAWNAAQRQLWHLTFLAGRMSARLTAAWGRRPRCWLVAVILSAMSMFTFVFRQTYEPGQFCRLQDSQGVSYFDNCP